MELEADSPWTIDRHSPLAFAITFELMQTNTLQWTQVSQGLRNV